MPETMETLLRSFSAFSSAAANALTADPMPQEGH